MAFLFMSIFWQIGTQLLSLDWSIEWLNLNKIVFECLTNFSLLFKLTLKVSVRPILF